MKTIYLVQTIESDGVTLGVKKMQADLPNDAYQRALKLRHHTMFGHHHSVAFDMFSSAADRDAYFDTIDKFQSEILPTVQLELDLTGR